MAREYVDFKGRGARVEFPSHRRIDEHPLWMEEKQIPYEGIIWGRGFWWVLLPNDLHPDAVYFPDDPMVPPRYVHRSKCYEARDTMKIIDEINDFYRKRGGRPKRKNVDADA